MSSTNRRDSSLAFRALPKLTGIEEVTRVDVRPVHERRPAAIPSIVRPAASTPPPNVIPFGKPRAIAAHPHAVVTMAPFETPVKPPRPVDHTTIGPMPQRPPSAVRNSRVTPPPPAMVPAVPPTEPTTMMAAATRVATGWTPPRAVNAVAQPIGAPVTAWPAPITTTRPAQQMPAVAPEPAPEPAPWAQYDQLGLGAPQPKPHAQRAAKLVVNAYRLLGFGILTIIVVVLVGYIASTAFYYFSESWIVPMAVSPTDEKVVSLQAQLAEQQTARDKIVDELSQAERAIASQQRFQAEFAKAIKSDLDGRRLALGRIQALASAAAQTRASIKNQNAAYANASRRRMAEEYAAGLIDRTAMLSGKFQLAQITSSNLTLAERQADFETRAAELEAQTRSLDAILANAGTGNDTALSYEVLRIKQEYEASRLDLAKATEARDTLKAALERQDRIVASLKQSAYLRAIHDKASVAFVPYGNLSNVSKGTSLYACKLGMVFCYHVGEVLDILPGEVQFKHPHRDKNLRGQLVELKLDEDEQSASADDVLFVGGRPLLF